MSIFRKRKRTFAGELRRARTELEEFRAGLPVRFGTKLAAANPQEAWFMDSGIRGGAAEMSDDAIKAIEKILTLKRRVRYASDHGSVEKMAKALADGVRTVTDCEAVIKKAEDAKMDDLVWCDALVLGSPVHMGSIDWRVKKFIDTVCSGAWMQDKIVGKVGAVFASGAGYGGGGGGCELTMLALLNNIAELGLIIVPLPKSTPGYPLAGLQWGPYGRAHAEDLSPKGLSDDQVVLRSIMANI